MLWSWNWHQEYVKAWLNLMFYVDFVISLSLEGGQHYSKVGISCDKCHLAHQSYRNLYLKADLPLLEMYIVLNIVNIDENDHIFKSAYLQGSC